MLKTMLYGLWSCLFFYSAAKADTFTVKKIKDNHAIIESDIPLEVGKTYTIDSENLVFNEHTSKQANIKSRLNAIHLGAHLQFLNGDSILENTFSINGKYGWNHLVFEFGPQLKIAGADLGSGYNIDSLVGGYFNYNLVKNKFPTDLIYGPSFQLLLGSSQLSGGGSAQLVEATALGFITWFINQTSIALNTEFGWRLKKITSTKSDTMASGLTASLNLVYYF